MPHRKPANMRFVDDRIRPRDTRRRAGRGLGLGDHAHGPTVGTVQLAHRAVVTGKIVPVQSGIFGRHATDDSRIRVEQHLARIESVPLLRSPGAVHAIGVPLP